MVATSKRRDAGRADWATTVAGMIAGALAMHWGAHAVDPRACPPWGTAPEAQLAMLQCAAWLTGAALWHRLGHAQHRAAAGRRRTGAALRGALLAALVFGATHVGLTAADEAVVAVRNDGGARGLVAVGPALAPNLLGQRALPYRHSPHLDENWLRRSLQEMGARGPEANRFVFYADAQQASEIMLILEGLSCAPPKTLTGSWAQRLGYYLTGKTDYARAPVLLYQCSGSDMAALHTGLFKRG